MRILFAAILCLFAASPALAVSLDLTGEAPEGGLMIGKTDPRATVRLDGDPIAVSPQGDFLVGFDRDAKGEHTLTATGRDGSFATRTLTIKTRGFDIQRIDGLPEQQVTPNPQDLARIHAEAQSMKVSREVSSPVAMFRSGFDWPADGQISGVYGSQRILNGQARAPHYGLDIAGPIGTPVRAAADGVVAFIHPDMYFNGRTLVLDHGLGLNSIYLHLSEITVAPGAQVKKGDLVGRMGATGRVTGPHLHWEVQLNSKIHLDPQLLVPKRTSVETH